MLIKCLLFMLVVGTIVAYIADKLEKKYDKNKCEREKKDNVD